MKLIGFKEAAEILGVQVGTLRGWVFQRKIPYVKVGRLVKFRPEDIEQFIESNRVSARSE